MINNLLKFSFTIFLVLGLSGCELLEFEDDKHVSSSLLEYLYPSGEHIEMSKQGERHNQIPHIELPVRVGIAFVPKSAAYSQITFTPAQQLELLKKVKTQFSEHQFIEHIELIPANYLQSKGGFTNLEQVASLYNLDLMALISYDQVQKSYAKDVALLYLTIIGAYVIEGDDNHTQSFVDTAVFDVSSRALLFRAPGTHKVRKNSSLNGKKLVQDAMSHKSFDGAMQDMVVNLDAELNAFTDRVKNEKVATVSYKSPNSGGGATSLVSLLVLVLVLKIKFFTFRGKYKRTIEY